VRAAVVRELPAGSFDLADVAEPKPGSADLVIVRV